MKRVCLAHSGLDLVFVVVSFHNKNSKHFDSLQNASMSFVNFSISFDNISIKYKTTTR